VLLYAQPLSRVRTLTVDDITINDEGDVYIGLENPLSPVPRPFAQILLQHSNNRGHSNAPPTPSSGGCSPVATPASPCTTSP
jgi:hypothetical protein